MVRIFFRLAMNAEKGGYKVDADGWDVGFSIRVICKSKEKTRLSDTTVSYKEKSREEVLVKGSWTSGKGKLLEQVVVFCLHDG